MMVAHVRGCETKGYTGGKPRARLPAWAVQPALLTKAKPISSSHKKYLLHHPNPDHGDPRQTVSSGANQWQGLQHGQGRQLFLLTFFPPLATAIRGRRSHWQRIKSKACSLGRCASLSCQHPSHPRPQRSEADGFTGNESAEGSKLFVRLTPRLVHVR